MDLPPLYLALFSVLPFLHTSLISLPYGALLGRHGALSPGRGLQGWFAPALLAAEARPQTHFLVYLEPRERVCWLQMSSHFC